MQIEIAEPKHQDCQRGCDIRVVQSREEEKRREKTDVQRIVLIPKARRRKSEPVPHRSQVVEGREQGSEQADCEDIVSPKREQTASDDVFEGSDGRQAVESCRRCDFGVPDFVMSGAIMLCLTYVKDLVLGDVELDLPLYLLVLRVHATHQVRLCYGSGDGCEPGAGCDCDDCCCSCHGWPFKFWVAHHWCASRCSLGLKKGRKLW